MSRSNMTIILCSSNFEPSQHSVAVTVYYVVMYDWVTRTVRLVMLRMKRRAVRWWRCLRNIFVQLNVLLIWNWCLVRTWRSFWVRVFLSQVNTLWLWLYTMWSCIIGWLEWYGSSRWDWNEEQCVGGVAQETYLYNWTYHRYEIDVSFEHDDHCEFDHFWAKSTLCGCDCIPCGHIRSSDRSIMVSI